MKMQTAETLHDKASAVFDYLIKIKFSTFLALRCSSPPHQTIGPVQGFQMGTVKAVFPVDGRHIAGMSTSTCALVRHALSESSGNSGIVSLRIHQSVITFSVYPHSSRYTAAIMIANIYGYFQNQKRLFIPAMRRSVAFDVNGYVLPATVPRGIPLCGDSQAYPRA